MDNLKDPYTIEAIFYEVTRHVLEQPGSNEYTLNEQLMRFGLERVHAAATFLKEPTERGAAIEGFDNACRDHGGVHVNECCGQFHKHHPHCPNSMLSHAACLWAVNTFGDGRVFTLNTYLDDGTLDKRHRLHAYAKALVSEHVTEETKRRIQRCVPPTWRIEHAKPSPGDHIILTQTIERYPHFIAEAGMHGTVVESTDSLVRIRMHCFIDGAQDWDNELVFSDADTIEVITSTSVVTHIEDVLHEDGCDKIFPCSCGKDLAAADAATLAYFDGIGLPKDQHDQRCPCSECHPPHGIPPS